MLDINKLSQAVPQADNVFTGDDGLLHCTICGSAVETIIENKLIGRRKVRCICDCTKQKMHAEQQAKFREQVERNRRLCFQQTELSNWTFDKADGTNERIMTAAKKYAEQFAEFRNEGKGLLFWGNVGTGKTFAAACIANAVLDEGFAVLMTNFATLTNKLQETFDGRQQTIDNLNRYSLLIIDDLGTERKSEYMQEIVFNVIDARYRAGLPLIVTTNLSIEEIKKPAEAGSARIYDRVLEMCHPIEVNGISKRRGKVKNSYYEMQNRLGLESEGK